jgi:hypothetical protein
MKSYQVFYIIKQNRREELNHMFVMATNQKEAIAICKKVVYEQTGRNAFKPTTKTPHEVSTINGNKVLTI